MKACGPLRLRVQLSVLPGLRPHSSYCWPAKLSTSWIHTDSDSSEAGKQWNYTIAAKLRNKTHPHRFVKRENHIMNLSRSETLGFFSTVKRGKKNYTVTRQIATARTQSCLSDSGVINKREEPAGRREICSTVSSPRGIYITFCHSQQMEEQSLKTGTVKIARVNKKKGPKISRKSNKQDRMLYYLSQKRGKDVSLVYNQTPCLHLKGKETILSESLTCLCL